ncbi:MAG: mercuric reductase [Verrucomicrobiota bacterium]
MNPPVEPLDSHNRSLLETVGPSNRAHPKPAPCYDLVVIGAGTAGLVTAAGAAGLGARVALVERHLMGGDCLNAGCVPSKALLRSAYAAAELGRAAGFGIPGPDRTADFGAVMERLRRLRSEIAPHDGVQRFEKLGVDVFLGPARFHDSSQVEVNGIRLPFRRAVIATGARPQLPEIPGLQAANPLTNETVFNLTQLPRRWVVLGGGPIGCELAQAFQRLGSTVTLLHNKGQILGREDPEAAAVVQKAMIRDGVRILCNSRTMSVVHTGPAIQLHVQSCDAPLTITCDALLVATGRTPNVSDLNLEGVGVEYDLRRGIVVNDFLQTTNPRIYACGDVCLPWKFTHAADAAARLVIRNALFALGPLGRGRVSRLSMAWCTYTDPELAHTGMTRAESASRGIEIDTYTQSYEQVDRAVVDSDTEGFVRIHTRRGTGEIVGGTIVGRGAGDLISELSIAIAGRVGLGRIASVIHPYPTRADALRRIGDQYLKTRFTPRTAAFLKGLLRLRRN